MDELVDRACALAQAGQRALLGITGCPGAGKSTLAEALVRRLGPTVAALVPMDGAYLSTHELTRRGRLEWKGAIDTFDGAGYVTLLERLRRNRDSMVMAPEYRRAMGESIANALPVLQTVPLVVTEGIYLLAATDEWADVRTLLDECWYLDVPEDVRLAQLVERHIHFGRSRAAALAHALRSDEPNAATVRATRHRADLFIDGSALEY